MLEQHERLHENEDGGGVGRGHGAPWGGSLGSVAPRIEVLDQLGAQEAGLANTAQRKAVVKVS